MTDHPNETPVGAPDDYALLLLHFANRIAIVDGDSVALCAPNGYWYPISRTGQDPYTSVLMLLVTDARLAGGYNAPVPKLAALQHCSVRLHQLAHQPQLPRVRYIASADFNRHNTIPLASGDTLRLDTREIIAPGDMPPLLLTPPLGTGVRWRPELLAEPPASVAPLVAHYGEEVLDRIGRHLALGPDKAIDQIISLVVHSGKDTLCEWTERALPGLVITRPLEDYVSGQGTTFTQLERDLCDYRIVFANEADKLKKEIPSSLITKSTSARLTDIRKGKDGVHRRRLGNWILVGNAAPEVESGPGVAERLGWAIDKDWPVIPLPLVAAATGDDDAADWLAAHALDIAMRILLKGDHTANEGAQAAAAISAGRISDEGQLLAQSLESGLPYDFVAGEDIRKLLAVGGYQVNAKTPIGKWVREAAPGAKRYRKAQVWGFRGLRVIAAG